MISSLEEMKTKKLIEAKKFDDKVIFIRAYSLIFKDSEGQVIYTFKTKKKADEFLKVLTKK